jgi:sugar phosphate isomerase/epimerase
MTADIRKYARIGLAHFMLYPDCVRRERVNFETLPAVLARDDIEAVDFCLPFHPEYRARLSAILRASDKRRGFAIHPYPLDKISMGSTADNEKALTRMILDNQIEAAAAASADSFTIASGIDVGDEERPAAMAEFREVCRWVCGRAAKYGIPVLLEPFDRGAHRCFLMGPTVECAAFIESLQPEVNNLRIQLDIAHVRLSGEELDSAVKAAGEHLGHVHLGNCVMKDHSDPFFGDKHPPIGYPTGEIDVPELTQVLRALLDVGYLGTETRGTLVFETQPLPGGDVTQLIEDCLAKLWQAWERV